MASNVEQRRTVHGGPDSALCVEVCAIWHRDETPTVIHAAGDWASAAAAATGFGVYLRNPLALHLRDFAGPEWDGEELGFGLHFSQISEALLQAYAFADIVADFLGCKVASHSVPRTLYEGPQTPGFVAAETPAARRAMGMRDEQIAENAACLWEAALDAFAADRAIYHARAVAQKERDGMAALRNTVCHLVEEAEEAWNALSEDVRDTIAFDWEFCPPWLYHRMGWTDEAPTFGPQVYQATGEAPQRMDANDLYGEAALTAKEAAQATLFLCDAAAEAWRATKVAPVDSVSVVKREHGDHGEKGPGQRLTMADGSIWFHPYSGGAPVREA